MRKSITLMLLGAACGTAVASTEIQAPCPELAAQTDVLHAVIKDDTAALTETAAEETQDTETEQAESPVTDAKTPEFTTRLPGVSANDMPGFRRHMFRTDI